ncbi:hypothetical protein [Falsiphaeobacter marinintestinus]|uniref:hypothetical protein n=1 Tax=Falsiphaeobacter marinintestinus TaxID=1492905 RepID=UPI0011B6C1C3|nr:hypothetical protein [Phaeobacter marinintestinus]
MHNADPDLLRSLMIDDAKTCNQRMRRVMTDNTVAKARPATSQAAARTAIRSKVACESCGRLIARDQTHKHGSATFCGSESCRTKLVRWAKYRRAATP